jgi:hypothetical protein
MVGIQEVRNAIKGYIPHDEYYVRKLTIKNDGDKGYQITLYDPRNHLELAGFNDMGLELLMCESYYEPNFRKEFIYLEN